MAAPQLQPRIDTCHACGKLFPRTSVQLCAKCALNEENRFRLVRDFLVENDGAAVGEISAGTGVSASDVRRFVDGGRLVQVLNGRDRCTCDGTVGQRCRSCRAKLAGSFQSMERTMRAERQSGDCGDAGRTQYVRRIHRIGERDE